MSGNALAGQVRANGGRVATGFLGTPLVLPALTATGHIDEAYLALLCRDIPSWLYQVTRGATTVWERWDAIRPDGSIHPGKMASQSGMDDDGEGHMLSFNHYAYGAVIDWVYRHVAGIATVIAAPGYRQVVFAPRPHEAITWSRAEVASAFGPVSIDWRLEETTFFAEFALPFGTTGSFVAPATSTSSIVIDGTERDGPVLLGPGRHTAIVTNAAVVAQP